MEPGAASLALAAFAPSILRPVTVTPPALALLTSLFAPTILRPVTVQPAPASLSLAAFAPVVLGGVLVVVGYIDFATGASGTELAAGGRQVTEVAVGSQVVEWR